MTDWYVACRRLYHHQVTSLQRPDPLHDLPTTGCTEWINGRTDEHSMFFCKSDDISLCTFAGRTRNSPASKPTKKTPTHNNYIFFSLSTYARSSVVRQVLWASHQLLFIISPKNMAKLGFRTINDLPRWYAQSQWEASHYYVRLHISIYLPCLSQHGRCAPVPWHIVFNSRITNFGPVSIDELEPAGS